MANLAANVIIEVLTSNELKAMAESGLLKAIVNENKTVSLINPKTNYVFIDSIQQERQ